MATVYVSIGDVGVYSKHGGVIIMKGAVQSETITSGAAAVSGALVASKNQVAMIYCATPVYVTSIGDAEDTGNGMFVPGGIYWFYGMTEGSTLSVIDAS